MGVRKGQMMISGLILLGVLLTTLSLNVFEFDDTNSDDKIFNNIKESTPYQVKTISEEYSGQEFIENFQALSLNYRDRVSASGSKVSYTVLVGQRSNRDLDVYTGNFGSKTQSMELEINNNTKSFSLTKDQINQNTFSASDGYSVSLSAEHFSKTFEVFDNSFVLVHYRYSGDGIVRQDTYIG